MDPPAGVEIRDGMNYNPYFPGGAISMARVLFDGLVEYDDGMLMSRGFCDGLTYSDRHPRHHLPNGQGRCHLLELGRRARTR